MNITPNARTPRGNPFTISMRSWLGERLNAFRLHRVPRCEVDFRSLASAERVDQDHILDPRPLQHEWERVEGEIRALIGSSSLLDYSANPGDLRALYHFVRCLQPVNVLEIGTLFGVSTLYIGTAMRLNANVSGGRAGKLTTVDIQDIDAPEHPWRRYGFTRSPRAMAAAAGLREIVQFVTLTSSEFLRSTERRFDFAYLDGSTAAADVYRDLQYLPKVMQAGAVALLHGYFPDGRALLPGQRAITGPWRAVIRHQAEGTGIAVRPLSKLPWPTKGGTQITNLAIIGG